MSTPAYLVIIYVVATGVIFALGAALYRISSKDQRTEFQNRLFIQLLGTVALGAVVTFSVYTIEHSREAEQKLALEKKVAFENKMRVIGNIRQELAYNKQALTERADQPFDAGGNRLKTEFWKIAGLSGDLRWLDDPDLLSSIAQAYFDVDVAAEWERRLIDVITGPALTITMNFGDGSRKAVSEFVDPFMRKAAKRAAGSVDLAISKLPLRGG